MWVTRACGILLILNSLIGNSWAEEQRSVCSLPLNEPRWTSRSIFDPAVEELLLGFQRKQRDSGHAPISAFRPLAVGDLVFVREPHRCLAINVRTGKIEWVYPWTKDQGQGDLTDEQTNWFIERTWFDVTNTAISTDGRQVFLLNDNSFPNPHGRNINALSELPANANMIAALDIQRMGALKWIIGGVNGSDEPKLSGAYFRNAPLANGESLYLLADIDTTPNLLCIAATNGRLLWPHALQEMPVAPTPRLTLGQLDSIRRTAGGTVAIARDIAVCVSNNGSIEAVDTRQQKQLWLYDYVDERRAILFDDSHNTDERWIEPIAIAVDDLVVVTASDCDWIFCLELQSGNPKWKQRRGAALYVSGVNQNQILLISPHDVTSVRISDGQPAWNEPLSLGETLPSGRGFFCEQFYFLPTTSAVLKIDITSGKIVDRAAVKSPLGNILLHKGEIISQSPCDVSAVPTQ